MFRRTISMLILLGLVFFLGLYVMAAHTDRNPELPKPTQTQTKQTKNTTPDEKAKDRMKDSFKDAVKEFGDKAIDRLIPGGDNHVAHHIWDDTMAGHPVRATVRAIFEPSEISPKQGQPGIPLTIIKSGPDVVPANLSNDTAITREHVTDTPAMSATTSNQNATTPVVVPRKNDLDNFLDDDEFEDTPRQTVSNRPVVPASPSNANAPSASAKPDRAPHNDPSTPERTEPLTSHEPQQTLSSGQQKMEPAQQMDMVRTSEGHYQTVPHESQPAPAATPAPAPSSSAPRSRTPDRGPGGRSDPMGGAREINRGVDKPDHNTPSGRDVSGVS